MRTRFSVLLLVLLALLAGVNAAAAQEGQKAAAPQATGVITGRLTDSEKMTPLASAYVEVIGADGRRLGAVVTDAQGQFRLPSLPPGTYALVFQMTGYQTDRVEGVRVVPGETTMTGASLNVAPFPLDGIVVTASNRAEKALNTPASTSLVSEREIAERPTTNPYDHVRNVPGIDNMETGLSSRNVVARGFNNIFSGALHTLTDYRIAGVPSLRVNFMHFVPQNNEDIGRMEVVLGPASALYGPNTANGVLHLLTKSPLEEQGTTVSFAAGEQSLLNPMFRTAHKLGENFGFKISGQYFKAEEWAYRDATEDSIAAGLPNPALFPPGMPAAEVARRSARIAARDFDIERWSGDVRADWRASDDLTTVFSAGVTNANGIELTGIGAGQAVDWRYMYAQARANYRKWFAQTYVNASDAGETFLLRNGAPITDKSKVWVSQLQHATSFGTRQSFTYGADFISTMPETEGTINGLREDEDNYTEFGAYLQSQTVVTPKLDLVLAGRLDKHSELPDAVFSPRAALVFKPAEAHTVRLTYNRAFSTPTSLNLFLDIDGGPLGPLGPFGYRVHAQGPGREGISLRTNGQVMMRTPFAGNPTALVAIDGNTLYDMQLNGLIAASAAAGQPIPQNLQQFLRNERAGAVAAAPVATFDPLARVFAAYDPNAIADIPGIEESTTSTVEFGYKGILGDRLLLAADAWWSQQENFTSPLITGAPALMLSPQQLAGYLIPRITQALMAGGMPQPQAQATATAMATTMAQLPGGVVSSNEVNVASSDLLVTYRNFGKVDLSGFDLTATAILSPTWQFGVTGSLVSDDFFRLPLGNTQQVVALNAPAKKATARLTYRNSDNGLNAEARVRYTDEFPANSAGFVGLSCVDATAAGECVNSYTIVDLTAGYRIALTGATVQLSINNLLDEKYQSFIGVPTIRRMAIVRLKYDL